MLSRLAPFAIYLIIFSRAFTPAHAVYNGRRATDDDYYSPMAHFAWKPSSGYEQHLICGGTLITFQHVLTAAHCHLSAENHEVFIGSRRLYQNGVRLDIEHVYECGEYDCKWNFNDLALVRLEPGAKEKLKAAGIRPMTINWTASSFPRNTPLEVMGFGARQEKEDARVSSRLHLGASYTLKNRKCNELYAVSGDRAKSICLDGRESSACKGDSGGPVVVANGAFGHPQLVGVVNGGEPTENSCIEGEIWHAANVEAHKAWISECVAKHRRWAMEEEFQCDFD